jgi:hypothetical protein
MPGYERDQVAIDNTVENRQLGSIMLTLGWILLWGDAVLSAFFFISLRDGSMFWPIWLAVEGIAGLALVIMGTRYRRTLGATKLGQKDMEHTRADERRTQAEEEHVA